VSLFFIQYTKQLHLQFKKYYHLSSKIEIHTKYGVHHIKANVQVKSFLSLR